MSKKAKYITAFTTVQKGESLSKWPSRMSLWEDENDAHSAAYGEADVVKLKLRVVKASRVRAAVRAPRKSR